MIELLYTIGDNKYIKIAAEHCKKAAEISRFYNILPVFLLFWPCVWGLCLGYNEYISKIAMLKAVVIFFIGAVAGRSFGCIVNDIIDKDIDIGVERTKNRAIASGRVSVKYAVIVAIFWLLIGLFCLSFLNSMAYLFVIAGVCLAIIYPFTKRFLKSPQIILGAAFNIGIFVGYSAIYKTISNSCVALYLAGIYWTLFYDTIYATADLEDDLRLGINSTATRYVDDIPNFVFKCAIMTVGLLVTSGILANMPWQYYIFTPIIFLEFAKITLHFKRETRSISYCFNRNSLIGGLIALQIFIGKCFYG